MLTTAACSATSPVVPHLSPFPPPPTATTIATVHGPHNSVIPITRRHLLTAISLSVPLFAGNVAGGRGLFQMPPPRLSNEYYLVRAGESEFEGLGIINTNPVAKTSVDSGLSEKGKKQTLRAALELKAMGACASGCWIWPSITQRAYQAAEIISAINGISRRYGNCC
uniref:Phosphoglycerate mutase n=1 Tax=Rhizophora mucronata TaxID=61149 RepID=A0A2P2JRQ0_RHIMU